MNLTSSTSESWPVDAIPESWIENLFEKMVGYYGAKFADQWRGSDPGVMKRIWAIELGKLTNAEMKTGADKLISQDWPPSLPVFIKLCKPSIDPLVAYYEAVAGIQARKAGEMGVWSHPAIYWAAMPLSFDLGLQTYSQMKARWESALSEQMERGEWEAIPAPMIALPAPGKAEMSKENAAKMLKELDAVGVVKSATSKTDHKRWAKRIIERAARGDKTLHHASLKFAKEAMAATDA